jgi:hypothetical protein
LPHVCLLSSLSGSVYRFLQVQLRNCSTPTRAGTGGDRRSCRSDRSQPPRGTERSNPVPSSGESSTNRSSCRRWPLTNATSRSSSRLGAADQPRPLG